MLVVVALLWVVTGFLYMAAADEPAPSPVRVHVARKL